MTQTIITYIIVAIALAIVIWRAYQLYNRIFCSKKDGNAACDSCNLKHSCKK